MTSGDGRAIGRKVLEQMRIRGGRPMKAGGILRTARLLRRAGSGRVPFRGCELPAGRHAASRSHAKIRAVGEPAVLVQETVRGELLAGLVEYPAPGEAAGELAWCAISIWHAARPHGQPTRRLAGANPDDSRA